MAEVIGSHVLRVLHVPWPWERSCTAYPCDTDNGGWCVKCAGGKMSDSLQGKEELLGQIVLATTVVLSTLVVLLLMRCRR
jgi:hypothetical protein